MSTSELVSGNRPAGGAAVRRLMRRSGAEAEPPVEGLSGTVRRPPFAWRTRVLLPLALLLGFGGALAYTTRDALIPPKPVKVVPVMLVPISVTGDGAQAGSVIVQAPGWIEPEPFAVAVSSLTDGFVRDVLVLEGEPVGKGQVVARLVDDDAKLALARAEADLAQREAALEAAQTTWDNPTERTRAVASTEARLEQANAELKTLESEIEAAIAKSTELRYESERLAKAFEKQAATALEAVISKQRSVAADAMLESTRRRVPVLRQQIAAGQAEERAAKENQRLRIEETRALAEAKAAADLSRVARDEAKLRLDRMEIRSPCDGVVLSRHAEPGSKLMLAMDHPFSSVVVKVYDPKRLQVRVDVPLADAGKVFVGQPAQVMVAKLPDRVFNGKVARVMREADVQKNTQQFKVTISDPSTDITPEMLARVKFLSPATTRPASAGGGGTSTAVFAPLSVLQRNGESAEAKVWVIDPASKSARQKSVQLGTATRGGWVPVQAGLMPGDQLIADPTGLTDGQKVRIDGEAAVAESANTAPVDVKEASHGVH